MAAPCDQNASVNWIVARGWRRVLVCIIGVVFACRGAVGAVLSSSRQEWWPLVLSALVLLFGLVGAGSILLPARASESGPKPPDHVEI